jgi:1-acyl-sn-glycerol-3-phosphate acyltransferase
MNPSPSLPTALDAEVPPLSFGAVNVATLPRVFWSLIALHRTTPRTAHDRAVELRRLCTSVCEMHGIEVEVQGRIAEGPAVIVCNHLGYIDPIVLCSLLPCSPIAKKEIEAWPLVGLPLSRLEVNFVRRGDPLSGARVLRRALATLAAGISVLNFPEGTTSRGTLQPFHLGAFWLARRSGVPVVPIGMTFEDDELCWVDDEAFLPHYAKVWCKQRLAVRVNVGEPLEPARFQSEADLSFAARGSIAQLLRPVVSSGA